MTQHYMGPTDVDAFVDMSRKTIATYHTKEHVKYCPICHGYGGWNLKLNAYRLPGGMDDTPENRHLYVHFRACCSHCNGRGYVSLTETCTGHEWQFVANIGRFYNKYRCIHCLKTIEVDSSD